MNYADLLNLLDEHVLILWLLCLTMFITAALGNTRVVRSLLYAAALFFGLSGLFIAMYPSGGMGIAVLVIYLGFGAFAFFILHLGWTQIRNRKPSIRLNRPLRTAVGFCGVLLLLLSVAVEHRYELTAWMLRRAVLSGDAEGVKRCVGKFQWLGEDFWDAVAERPHNPETLALLDDLMPMWANRGYVSMRGISVNYGEYVRNVNNGWTIILRHPVGEARLNSVRRLAKLKSVPPFFIAVLYEQKDAEAFSLAAHEVDSIGLATLAEHNRYDILAAIRSILDGGAGSGEDGYLGRIRLNEFFSEPELFAEYLKAGANPNHTDADGLSILMLALRQNRTQAADLLLKNGADLAIRDNAGRTALFYAVIYDNTPALKNMLRAGGDPSARDASGLTPLHLAAWLGNLEMIKALLAAGAEADGPEPGKVPSPLFFAAPGGGLESLARLLTALGDDAGELVMRRDEDGESVFELAAAGMNAERLCRIIDDVDSPDLDLESFGLRRELGAYSNWRALQTRKSLAVDALLQAGADPRLSLPGGDTVLHALFGGQNSLRTMENFFRHYRVPAYRRELWCGEIFTHGRTDDGVLAENILREYGEALNAVAGFIPLGGMPEDAERVCRGAVSKEFCREKIEEMRRGTDRAGH